MNNKISAISALVCVFVISLVASTSLFGAEAVENNYIRVKTKTASLDVEEGEVHLKFETGDLKTVKEGESEGAIPDGTIISVISGSSSLTADKTMLELKEGDKVLLFIDETYRTTSIQVPNKYPDELTITTNGETQTLAAGETFWAPTSETAKAETKATKTTAPKDVKEEEKTDEDTSSVDTSPITDEDTIREERTNQEEAPPETPKPSKRKPGSDSGQ